MRNTQIVKSTDPLTAATTDLVAQAEILQMFIDACKALRTSRTPRLEMCSPSAEWEIFFREALTGEWGKWVLPPRSSLAAGEVVGILIVMCRLVRDPHNPNHRLELAIPAAQWEAKFKQFIEQCKTA